MPGAQLDAAAGVVLMGPCRRTGLAESVHDAPEERPAHRDLGDAAGAPDLVAFLDLLLPPRMAAADACPPRG